MKMIYNFEKICRACSLEGTLQSLFIEDPILLVDMLNQIVNFKVDKDDDFPQNICTNCLEKLKSAYRFIQQCHDVNIKFKEEKCKQDTKLKSENQSVDLYSEYINTENDHQSKKIYENNEMRVENESVDVYNEVLNVNTTFEFYLDNADSKKDVNMKSDKSKWKKFKLTECKVCLKSMHKRNLSRHLRTHTGDRQRFKFVECKICLKSLHECNLARHLRTHTGERPYVCPICDKGFVQKFGLEVHKRIHTGERPYNCNHCEKSFKQSYQLLSHIKLKHIEEIKPLSTGEFECKICAEKFSTQQILASHRLLHKKGAAKIFNTYKEQLCNYCGKAFPSNVKLREHIHTHTGERPYKCDTCEKSFTTCSLLHAHRRRHLNEKPFKCSFCEKSFKTKLVLHNHELTHTGDKPFKCKICNQNFRQKTHLKYHSYTHTGEKQYKCTYCDKQFALKCTLTVHMRMHTGETPYVCSICDKGFYDSSSMKRHKKKHLLLDNNHEKTECCTV